MFFQLNLVSNIWGALYLVSKSNEIFDALSKINKSQSDSFFACPLAREPYKYTSESGAFLSTTIFIICSIFSFLLILTKIAIYGNLHRFYQKQKINFSIQHPPTAIQPLT